MKNNNFLRIPINRIIALILLDIMSIIVASVGALYIRFDFNFSSIPVGYFEKLENVIAFNIIVTLVFLHYGNFTKAYGDMQVQLNY